MHGVTLLPIVATTLSLAKILEEPGVFIVLDGSQNKKKWNSLRDSLSRLSNMGILFPDKVATHDSLAPR